MASASPSRSPLHTPPPLDAVRPRGILKHGAHHSPPPAQPLAAPVAAVADAPPATLTDKERTLYNTQINAGHRRSSSAARAAVSRRQSSSRSTSSRQDGEADGGGDGEADAAAAAAAAAAAEQRLKWDEVNLYLTEQERTATMKIDEPKTPYARHYDPAEDPSDDEGGGLDGAPGLSLGEPEEAVPEGEFAAASTRRSATRVQVDDTGSVHGSSTGGGGGGGGGDVDPDDPTAGMSAEEREKHHRFELMRKKHYEMKNVAQLLGHPEELDALADGEEDEDEGEAAATAGGANGRANGSTNGNGGTPPVPGLPRTT